MIGCGVLQRVQLALRLNTPIMIAEQYARKVGCRTVLLSRGAEGGIWKAMKVIVRTIL